MIAREIGKGNAGSPGRASPRGRPSIPSCKAREDLRSKRPGARKEREQAAPSVLRARDLAHVEFAPVVFAKSRRVPVERTGDDRGENARAGNIPESRGGSADLRSNRKPMPTKSLAEQPGTPDTRSAHMGYSQPEGLRPRDGNRPAGQLAIEKARHRRNSELCMIRHLRCPGASVEHRDESNANGRGILLYASLQYLGP